MSEIATRTEAPNHRLHPADVLMGLLATLLAPIFVCATAGDIALARMAAIETIKDYRARNHADLIAVAQIIGYGLTALGSLGLSMADDLSLSMTLRLRGNAVSLNRSAEQNRRAIRQNRDASPIPRPAAPAEAPESRDPVSTLVHDAMPDSQPEAPETWQPTPDPDVGPEFESFLSPEAERLLAAESEARLQAPQPTRPQAQVAAFTAATEAPETPATPETPENSDHRTQAIAMVKQALKIEASIPHLPPAERADTASRVAELNSIANQLLAGLNPTPPSFAGPEPPTVHP